MISPGIKTVMITGAGSGMGRETALMLASLGKNILAADLNLQAAMDTAGQIKAEGGEARALAMDVSDPESVAAGFDAAREQDGAQMLIHAAAILGDTAFIQDIGDDTWRSMMAVNLDGAFYCAREAVKLMLETGGGRIVFFSSVASLTATPGALAYSAAKGAVNMLAKTLAAEVAKHNIRVNVIAPGYVETPMLEGLPTGFADYIKKKTPLRRLGLPKEIAGLAAFLASEEADFITGQVISPNGGLVI